MIVVFSLALALVPIVAWNGRSLILIVLLVGGPLMVLWSDQDIRTADLGSGPGLEEINLPWLVAVSGVGFGCMAIARAIGLYGRRRRWGRKWLVGSNIAGATVAAAIIIGTPIWSSQVADRSPIAGCLSKLLTVRLEGRRYEVPVSEGVSITLLSPDGQSEWLRHLGLPRHRRDICNRIRKGELPLHVAAIRLGGRKWQSDYRAFCTGLPTKWKDLLCQAKDPDDAEPFDMTLLSETAQEEAYAERGRSSEAFDASRLIAPWKNDAVRLELDGKVKHYADDFFVLEPENADHENRVIAACQTSGEFLSCDVDEPLQSEIWMNWSFTTPPETASAQLIRQHDRVHRILELMTR
ncbi:hypothetical protein KHP62_00580 [Rhodobacteraceae bacterium NNCM2]|nr:hypothetical protein [Coraliihabitans acroporae]